MLGFLKLKIMPNSNVITAEQEMIMFRFTDNLLQTVHIMDDFWFHYTLSIHVIVNN